MLEIVSDAAIYEEVFEKMVEPAQRSVWIATANVKNLFVSIGRRTGSFLELFEALTQRGVEIRILHAGVPSGSFMKDLKERRGLLQSPLFTMRMCVRTHFKCVLADGERMFVGSANLTGAGMGMKGGKKRNFELGFVSDEDLLMDQVAAYYDAIWSGARCGDCGRKKDCIVPLEEPARD